MLVSVNVPVLWLVLVLIALMMVLRYEPIEVEEVAHLRGENRGGYGSTGTGLP